jgi:hypothetical protein
MGYKGNTHVKKFVERNSATLQALADTVLGASVKESHPQTRGMEDDDANAWVEQIVYGLGKLKGNAGLKNSYIQGPLKIVMRLVLGQLLAAALRELDEDAQYIGCAPEVLVAGKNVLKGIDKIVNGNKAIDNIGKGKPTGSRSSSSCGRPEIKDFLLNGVQAMCKQAKTVQCRASITSFMCALCFSIMKGEKADHVDAWNLSNSKSVAKSPERFFCGVAEAVASRKLVGCEGRWVLVDAALESICRWGVFYSVGRCFPARAGV